VPNLPQVPNLPKVPEFEIKDKVANISRKISRNIEKCYDLTMHHASLYDFRNEKVVGVDITPNCIYLCQIDALNGKRVLTSLTSVCMEGKFITQDIADNSDEYANSLKDLVKSSNIKTKNVALSIPVSSSIVKTVTIPALKDKEIEKALKYGTLWNNIMSQDTKPEDYSIFYQVIRRNKSTKSMDVLFVATKLSDVNIYTKVIEDSGLNPVIVDVRSFAISNAYNHKLNNPDASGACAFLEFGLEENYAMIIDSGKANIMQINVCEIQRMALIDDRLDEEVINEFVVDYSNQVESILNKYQSENEDEVIKNLFVLSVVPRVNIIIAKLAEILDKYTLLECNFFDCMKINDDFTISGESARQNLSSWAAAIGVALRKIDIFGSSTDNKRYPNMIERPGEYSLIKRTNYAMHCLAVALTVYISFEATHATIALNKENKAVSEELAKFAGVQEAYNKNLLSYKAMYGDNSELRTVLALMEDASESQQKILSVYKYLNLVILEDVWLREIRFKSPDTLEIVGGSDNDRSILEFVELLNEGNHFNKVSLKGMKEIREVSVQHADVVTVKTFRLESTLSREPVYDFNDVNLMAGDMNSGS